MLLKVFPMDGGRCWRSCGFPGHLHCCEELCGYLKRHWTLKTDQMSCIRDCIMDLNSVSLSFYNDSDTCFGFIWPLWDSVSLYMKKR
jgi:hypothetical protein